MQMNKKCFAYIIILVSIIFIIISNFNFIYADVSSTIWGDVGTIAGPAKTIVDIILWVGIAVLVGAVITKGIKFVTSSPDGKADVKKEIIMLVIGAVILFSVVTILNIILGLVNQAGLQ